MGGLEKNERQIEELKHHLAPYLNEHRKSDVKFDPEKSALMVIDMQRFFLDPSSHAYLPSATTITDNVMKLIDTYHHKALPVIYTRYALLKTETPGMMGCWWGDVLYDDDRMSEILPNLIIASDDEIIRKTRYSAFHGTKLEKILRGHEVDSLVITGVMTHLCCETTARDAFVHDFKVFFVIDGTATQTEDLHISSLKTLTAGFAIPVTTKEMLAWLGK